jgi:hypothetical protein
MPDKNRSYPDGPASNTNVLILYDRLMSLLKVERVGELEELEVEKGGD